MESTRQPKALVPADQRPLTSVAARDGMLVPRVIAAAAGDQAARRFLEFFATTIRMRPVALRKTVSDRGVNLSNLILGIFLSLFTRPSGTG
jgi:hypothetical protein